MLRRSQVILSDFDIHLQLKKEHSTHPDHNAGCKYQMGPVTMCFCRPNITPSQLIQPCHVRGGCGICTISCCRIAKLQCIATTSAAIVVQWQKNRQDHSSHGYEYDQEGLQVAEKEIGIETTLLDNFTVSKSEDSDEPAPRVLWRRVGPFSFRDQVGLRLTELY
jgi:hypothetical protein